MTGRHRQCGAGVMQRALAGTVPALGVAGAVTGLVLSSGAAAPDAPHAGSPPGEATSPSAARTAPPAVRTEVPARADQAASAVSAAADAVREQGALAQIRDRRTVTAVAEQIRADAGRRDAAAQQQGRAEFEQFRQRQDLELRPRPAEPGPEPPAPPAPPAGQQCDPSGMPRLGPFANSDDIVDRDCGTTGGGERTQDPWIDHPLLSSALDD